MKVASLAGVTLGLAVAAFAQQDRFPATQNRRQSTRNTIATVPQAPLPSVTLGWEQPIRYGFSTVGRLPGVVSNSSQNKETAEASREVDSAVAKLKKATSDEDRLAAEDLVREKLGKLFDLKTESREREITALENRLAEMRDQLEKRSDQKNQIVRLRLQTLINEANGLTF